MIESGTTETLLEEAERLVGTVRRAEYGPAHQNFLRIADMWNVILRTRLKDGEDIGVEDVAIMMVCLKLARWCENSDKRDSLVDACGYIRLIEIMRDELKKEPLR